jgi:hypothetical protein
MNRRELLAAGIALALPVSATASQQRRYHPARPYNPNCPEDEAVLRAALDASDFCRDQWESLKDWIGAKPQEAVCTLVGQIGEDSAPVPTYMTVADALAIGRDPNRWSIGWEPLVVYRLQTWSESHLFLRASVLGFLPPPACVYIQPGRIEVKPPLQVGERIVVRIENASLAFDHFFRVDQIGAHRGADQ